MDGGTEAEKDMGDHKEGFSGGRLWPGQRAPSGEEIAGSGVGTDPYLHSHTAHRSSGQGPLESDLSSAFCDLIRSPAVSEPRCPQEHMEDRAGASQGSPETPQRRLNTRSPLHPLPHGLCWAHCPAQGGSPGRSPRTPPQPGPKSPLLVPPRAQQSLQHEVGTFWLSVVGQRLRVFVNK